MKVLDLPLTRFTIAGLLGGLAATLLPAGARGGEAPPVSDNPPAATSTPPQPNAAVPDAPGPATRWWREHAAPTEPVSWLDPRRD